MNKGRFILICIFLCNFLLAQKPVIYYSAYASKSQKDHTISLIKFFKEVSSKNAVGVVDGYNIEIEKEITVKNINNLELSFKNSNLYSNKRFSGFFINFLNSKNIKIDGFSVEMFRSKIQTYIKEDYPNIFNGGLGFKGCENIEVKNSKFLNLYTRSIQITESYGNVSINNNFFSSKKQNQKYLLEHVVFGSSQNAVISVSKNRFDNEIYENPDFGIAAISGYGLGKNGGKVIIVDNYINNAGRNNSGQHRLYAIDFYDDCDNLLIKGNTFNNIMWGAVRFNGSSENIGITDNNISIKNPDDTSCITSSTTGNSSYFRNISIDNNSITTLSGLNSAIMLQNQFEKTKTENISIKNNKINNSYNNIFILGYFDDVSVIQNVFKGTGSSMGIWFMLKNKQINKPIYIMGNKINAFNTGISLNSKDNMINYNSFFVKNNEIITGNKEFKGFGIIVNLGMKGNVNIEDNNILNYNTGLYIREKTVNTKLNKFTGNIKNMSRE
ncbi:hypothetical protein BOQ62_19505 [Chryseobacterium sp. CH21]|uniref:hypothetical protein n=1 Tax=Chryseobacterium sp. CH21 TaxID=713556 RepID=UPI00100ADB01|nr:hypothetical protein [Chryseobacterium sp. CH21]RXM37892.1 hypothetical protein BOQ62_19505 [Chryseobacterium sp. CH21]